MTAWHYSGQPRSEWPDWLVGTNTANDPTTGRIVVHGLELCTIILPGDCIERSGVACIKTRTIQRDRDS
jgi:hypothetical protein